MSQLIRFACNMLDIITGLRCGHDMDIITEKDSLSCWMYLVYNDKIDWVTLFFLHMTFINKRVFICMTSNNSNINCDFICTCE